MINHPSETVDSNQLKAYEEILELVRIMVVEKRQGQNAKVEHIGSKLEYLVSNFKSSKVRKASCFACGLCLHIHMNNKCQWITVNLNIYPRCTGFV